GVVGESYRDRAGERGIGPAQRVLRHDFNRGADQLTDIRGVRLHEECEHGRGTAAGAAGTAVHPDDDRRGTTEAAADDERDQRPDDGRMSNSHTWAYPRHPPPFRQVTFG